MGLFYFWTLTFLWPPMRMDVKKVTRAFTRVLLVMCIPSNSKVERCMTWCFSTQLFFFAFSYVASLCVSVALAVLNVSGYLVLVSFLALTEVPVIIRNLDEFVDACLKSPTVVFHCISLLLCYFVIQLISSDESRGLSWHWSFQVLDCHLGIIFQFVELLSIPLTHPPAHTHTHNPHLH